MSAEKPKPAGQDAEFQPATGKATNADRARIIRVSFRDPVEIGVGDFASIQAWTEAKHGKHIECAEKGNWIVMTVRGHRFRVPMTNVAYVVESVS